VFSVVPEKVREKVEVKMKLKLQTSRDSAVSPVIGVMLMLVITIIIAAVVSAFAGGLFGGNNKETPTLAMDVKIVNSGNAADSGFFATVLSVSEPTSTKQLKLTTSWVATMNANSSYDSGTVLGSTPDGKAFAGGNTTAGNVTATDAVPYGFGPGVTGDVNLTTYTVNQSFGNFTLMPGTGLIAEPASTYSGYSHISGSDLEKVLGTGWEQLRPGDIVTVRVIYAPTGKAIFQKEVTVSGG
jgi:FlaG/FlaF family flagellin (archaellin)